MHEHESLRGPAKVKHAVGERAESLQVQAAQLHWTPPSAQAQAICMQTQDFRRAFEAFAAKRSPVFEGD